MEGDKEEFIAVCRCKGNCFFGKSSSISVLFCNFAAGNNAKFDLKMVLVTDIMELMRVCGALERCINDI